MTALLLLTSLVLAADPSCKDGDVDACVAEERALREHLELSCNAGSANGCYHLALHRAQDTPYTDNYLAGLAKREACGRGADLPECADIPTLEIAPGWSPESWTPPPSDEAMLEGTLRIEVAGDVPYALVRGAMGKAAEAGFLRIQLVVDGQPMSVVLPTGSGEDFDPKAASRGTKGTLYGMGTLPEGSDPRGYGRNITLGALDKSLIDGVIKEPRNMKKIRYCYQRELTKDPRLGGKIVVKFVISKDGTVSKASVKSSSVHNEKVESCLTGVFMGFEFPEPKGGGIVIVSYPFVFAPG